MSNFDNKSATETNKIFTISIVLYLLMLPLGTMSLGSFGSLLKYIAILPIIIYLLHYRSFKLSKIIIIQLLIIYAYIISMFYSVDRLVSLSKIKTEILFCILLMVTGCANFHTSEVIQIRKGLVWSSRITCILLLFFGILEENRLGLSGSLSEDPNYLNGYLLFGIVSAVQVFLSDLKKGNLLISMMEMFFYIYASILTGSRGGLISMIVAVISITFFEILDKKNTKKKRILLSIIIMIILYIVGGMIPPELVNRFYWNDIIASKGTGRLVIWEESVKIFSESNLFHKIF